jgi:DNA-binding PadR family transcriptional regulator
VPKVPAHPELNATAASILGFLLHQPMTGFELMNAIENILGDFWNVTKSQIYRELKLLAEQGLVETLAAGSRDKQPYRITSSGRDAFRAWIRQRPAPPTVRMPIVLEVFFGGEVPFELLREHIEAMRAHHDERLRVYETFVPDAPKGTWPYEALRLGFMYQRTLIKWLDTLPKSPLAALPAGSVEKPRKPQKAQTHPKSPTRKTGKAKSQR